MQETDMYNLHHKDHSKYTTIELNEASDKSKQHATELLAQIRQSIQTFNIAIQEIDMSRKTLDSMFAATKEKISKKADEESAKEVARIREEQQKLTQEVEQIYKDRVETMETARVTNSKEMNKAELKQDEVIQLMEQQINIVHHIEQILQDLKEYKAMESTKVADGLTYMDFKEGQKVLGRLLLKDEWTLKTNIKTTFTACDVSAYSNSDIVLLHGNCVSVITISADMAKGNPQPTVIPQELPIKGLTGPSRVTVNKNDELIVLDNGTVKIFNRNYQPIQLFNLGSTPSCITVDDNNLIAVGYKHKAKISLHKPDGTLIRTLPAPEIGTCRFLTTYKQRLIYTKWNARKLVSVDYNGKVGFSVGINQYGWPRGVCCDKDGSIYLFVAVWKGPFFSSLGAIHHYSPDGEYIGCIIKECANSPNGVAVTLAGDLAVAAHNSGEIHHNSPDGEYIGCTNCIIKDCANYTIGLTVTPAGDLAVAAHNSVKIYKHE